MIELRPYQRAAIEAVLAYWEKGGGNPLVDLATGLGKSVVIAKLTQDILRAYPDMRVVMLVHSRELVEQNFKALLRLWPDAPVGIYSAGLGRRDAHHRITFASVQSVYKHAATIGPRDLILIDEAHLVPKAGDGMYRTLLDGLRKQRPDMRVAGFTATAFRLDSGRLDQGDGRLFDEIVYSYGIGPGIADGWLSPLMSKASAAEIDVTNVARRGGEFVAGALETAADRDDLVRAAAAEIVRYGADRKSWLLFCSGVQHAVHVRDAIAALGVPAATVTGETPLMERARMIRDFREGRLRCLTNAQVLTTGFDAPATDLIAFLRPTLSTGLYLQMTGRGVRKAEGKANCLVLDFAGNVRRHGPVDAVIAPAAKESSGELTTKVGKVGVETVQAKACPVCETLHSIATRTCPHCGYVWLTEIKHEAQADKETPILSTERLKPETVPVIAWEAQRHTKYGSPDSLRVTYFAGLQAYSEWVCLEHSGPALDRAERWWRRHGGGDPPVTIDDALQAFDGLTMPATISVRRSGKFFDIMGRSFAATGQEEAA